MPPRRIRPERHPFRVMPSRRPRDGVQIHTGRRRPELAGAVDVTPGQDIHSHAGDRR